MAQKSTPFKPKNVAIAAFSMFGSMPTQLSATALALEIQDEQFSTLIRQIDLNPNDSKQKLNNRLACYKKLLERLQSIHDRSIYEYPQISNACYALFQACVSDYNTQIRINSIEMASILLKIALNIYKDQMSHAASSIFPSLLLLYLDTDKEVSEKAKNLFFSHFQSKEKRNAILSRLRNEISLRIHHLFDELKKPRWSHLDKSQTNENWGRLTSMALYLSTNLLLVCHLNADIFTALSKPPVLEWLQVKSDSFSPQCTSVMRSAAYTYLSVAITGKLMEFASPLPIFSFIKIESSPVAQTKLIKLVISLIEKDIIPKDRCQEPFYGALYLYYQPKTVAFDKLLVLIKTPEFAEKCLLKVIQSPDISLATELFEVIFTSCNDVLTNEFLLSLLRKSVSPDESNKFLRNCSLDHFSRLKDDPGLNDIIANGDETRICELLLPCNIDQLISYLRSRKTITTKSLETIIKKAGTKPIREVWPNLKDIPITNTDDQDSFISFITDFVHSDEIEYVLEKYPDSIEYLLLAWKGDYQPFKTQALLNQAQALLDKNMNLFTILNRIFPNDKSLLELADSTCTKHLKEDLQLDPTIFEFFAPSNELLDEIIFGPAIDIIEPTDQYLIKYITKRINELIPTYHPVKLAKIAAKFIKLVKIDPINITTTPKDSPIFCYEFWNIIGFDEMNEPDFCNMLECYAQKKCPFLPVFLYKANINWSFIPKSLFQYIQNNPDIGYTAYDMKLLLSLSIISHVCQFHIESFDIIDGLVLNALSYLEPPVETKKTEEEGHEGPHIVDEKLVHIIQSEWNHEIPKIPTDINSTDLREAVSSLQHYLPVLEDFSLFKQMAITYIGSDNVLEFFMAIRLFSMLYEADQVFDPTEVSIKIMEQVERFSPIPEIIEKEIKEGFQITRFLTAEKFRPFIFNAVPYLSKPGVSQTISRLIIPTIAYFNEWDLIDHCFNNSLDLENVEVWHFITNALKEMPYKRRIETIPMFSSNILDLLSKLRIESDEFMMLIISFPSTAFNWSTTLSNYKLQPLKKFMEREGTQRVFKYMASQALKMKLDSSTITEDSQNRIIRAVYIEDPTALPIELSIKFPPFYPFARIDNGITCRFGNEGNDCAYKVFKAIDNHQSIEAGILAWHQFITYRLKEVEPCTICYSYLSTDMKKPSIVCPTCGQKFHGKCLKKWFTQCLTPTCPYCTSAWDEKKRDKKPKQ